MLVKMIHVTYSFTFKFLHIGSFNKTHDLPDQNYQQVSPVVTQFQVQDDLLDVSYYVLLYKCLPGRLDYSSKLFT